MIGDRLKGGKGKTFVDDVKADVDNLVATVIHRAKYGSPPLLSPSEDTGVSPAIALAQHQKRIQRRRALLGLPYEPWAGGTLD